MRTRESSFTEASSSPITTADAARLVEAFEACTLPRDRWTHAAHLVVGLWYVLRHDRARAFELVSAGIERYNRAAGRTPRERNGYDAEITRMWIERLADFANGATAEDLDDRMLRRALEHFLGQAK